MPGSSNDAKRVASHATEIGIEHGFRSLSAVRDWLSFLSTHDDGDQFDLMTYCVWHASFPFEHALGNLKHQIGRQMAGEDLPWSEQHALALNYVAHALRNLRAVVIALAVHVGCVEDGRRQEYEKLTKEFGELIERVAALKRADAGE